MTAPANREPHRGTQDEIQPDEHYPLRELCVLGLGLAVVMFGVGAGRELVSVAFSAVAMVLLGIIVTVTMPPPDRPTRRWTDRRP